MFSRATNPTEPLMKRKVCQGPDQTVCASVAVAQKENGSSAHQSISKWCKLMLLLLQDFPLCGKFRWTVDLELNLQKCIRPQQEPRE